MTIDTFNYQLFVFGDVILCLIDSLFGVKKRELDFATKAQVRPGKVMFAMLIKKERCDGVVRGVVRFSCLQAGKKLKLVGHLDQHIIQYLASRDQIQLVCLAERTGAF